MQNEFMNIVAVGHVDHGKSTVVGRLLADTHSLPEGKLEQVKELCAKNSKPFEYAFLIDALKDEQTQGITIDSARVFFKTEKRHYIIIDAPGHIEFLKNMITGAARAEAAFLVIDAAEGVQENSRRHGYMLAMLGITQIAVLINKMDLINYDPKEYERIVREYKHFLSRAGLRAEHFIPVSAREGDMIAEQGNRLDWYKGPTVLEMLDNFTKETIPEQKPLRLPVQDVYKFTKFDDTRRIVAGTIVSGQIQTGDEIIFHPSGKKNRVHSIESFKENANASRKAGQPVGLTLAEQIYIRRGELISRAGEPEPHVTTRFKASVFWLGNNPLSTHNEYMMKLGTARTAMRIEKIEHVLNASDLKMNRLAKEIQKNEVAECVIKLNKAMAFDCVDKFALTSRFVIVDNYQITGGGIIRKALEDKYEWLRENIITRNFKWIKSDISPEERYEHYKQKPKLIIITGEKDAPRKEIARHLEQQLLNEGKIVYFLGLGSIIYGVDADIKNLDNTHTEHLRRLAEVANILLDAGIILIITAIELAQDDIDMIKSTIDLDGERIKTVWVGERISTDIQAEIKIGKATSIAQAAKTIYQELG